MKITNIKVGVEFDQLLRKHPTFSSGDDYKMIGVFCSNDDCDIINKMYDIKSFLEEDCQRRFGLTPKIKIDKHTY